MQAQQKDAKITEEKAPLFPLPSRKKRFLIIGLVLVTVGLLVSILVFTLTRDDADKADTDSLSLAATGYTGVTADVLTNQSFACKARSEHEWYRTDHTLVIDYKDPNIMYVNVEYRGLYKTTDGGKTWAQKVKGIKVYAREDNKTKGCYSEYPVLRMDPSDNKHLVLGVSSGGGGFLDATTPNSQVGGVYQTFDGGERWKLMINNKMNTYVNDIAIDKTDPKTIYYGTSSNPASWQGADQNKLYVTKGLIYKTTNTGRSWTELPTGLGKHTGATSILVNPKNSKEIFAATYSANRVSADGSGTGVSTGKDTAVAQLGILKTMDGGSNWTTMSLPGNPPIVRAYASDTNFLHMFFAPEYVTLDGGASFRKSTNMDIVAYDPYDATGNHMLGYNSTAGTPTVPNLNIFESMDGGITWQPHGTVPKEMTDLNNPKTRPSVILWHPADKNTIFMSGAGGHIWKSTDLGATWVTLLDYTKLK